MKKKDNNFGGEWIDKSIYFVEKNRMQVFYNLVFILVIFMMIPGFISVLDGTTVEVDLPPRGKIVVQNDKANELYYQIWAEHFINNKEYIESIIDGQKVPMEYTFSIVDFDYANIDAKLSDFLKRYKPSKLIKESHIYASFVKNVKLKLLSQQFTTESIKTTLEEDGESAQVTVKGVANQKINGVEQPAKECQYVFGFERLGGKIYVTSLQTDCF